MGDGILAYFGYPGAHEDDAERAVRAGLGSSRAIGRLSPQPGLTLQVRIGIATGTVVVGDLVGERAAQEEAVVGETPDLAARLQAVAEPEIIISARTRRLIGGLFDCVDIGGLTLKGFSEPVPAWRVVAESASEDRFEAFHAHGSPIWSAASTRSTCCSTAGRSRATAKARWRCCRANRASASRASRRALRERIAGQPHLRLHHACSPHHQNSALYPIIARIEHAAGFSREDRCQPNAASWRCAGLRRHRNAGRAADDAGPARPAAGRPARGAGTDRRSSRRRRRSRRCWRSSRTSRGSSPC